MLSILTRPQSTIQWHDLLKSGEVIKRAGAAAPALFMTVWKYVLSVNKKAVANKTSLEAVPHIQQIIRLLLLLDVLHLCELTLLLDGVFVLNSKLC